MENIFADNNVVTQNKKELIKLMFIGDPKVGKTAIIHRIKNDIFIKMQKRTVGTNFMTIDFPKKNPKQTMQIWDTSGNESLRTSGVCFFKSMDIQILTFDMTNKKSLMNLKTWQETLNEYVNMDNKIKFLLGCKNDLMDEQQVGKEDFKDFSNFFKCDYIDLSCKNGNNIDEFLKMLKLKIEKGYQTKKLENYKELINLNTTFNTDRLNGCALSC